jgi:hypothetical protein
MPKAKNIYENNTTFQLVNNTNTARNISLPLLLLQVEEEVLLAQPHRQQ